jgi:hypothetical protein
MKTKILLLLLGTVFQMNLNAQGDYYYWGGGRKIYLPLFPTKKYVMLNSPEDTIAFKNHFTQDDITIQPFMMDTAITTTNRQSICWTTVEGESLPDFTSHEVVAYEAPYFVDGLVGLSHLFYVKLHKAEDLTILENMVTTQFSEEVKIVPSALAPRKAAAHFSWRYRQ